jgi:hypothetical protein
MTTNTRRRRCPKGRTFHLIDVENLCGGTAGTDEVLVSEVLDRYRRTIAVGPDDLVILGSGPTLAPAAKAAWPAARLVVGRGIDGADHALLDAADVSYLANRFDRVVIGSGDHVFVDLIIGLRARGTAVYVVTRDEESNSKMLNRWAPCRSLVNAARIRTR